MKTIASIIAAILLFGNIYANTEKVIKSKIRHVTVFQSGAQVDRSAAVNAGKGITDIVFQDLSPYINAKSLQVKGKGDFVILDVKYRIKHPEPVPPRNTALPPQIVKDIEVLSDSIAMVNFDLEDLRNRREFLGFEKKILLGNKYMKGEVDTITELEYAMDYLRKQLADINSALMNMKREEFSLQKNLNAMQTRLNALRSYNAHVNPAIPEKPKHQVVVTITSQAVVSGSLKLSYMVANAGWTPAYDIRATGVGEPVQIVYKANVYQQSGEDWENVKLKLSTITPNQGYTKPTLPVMYAQYYQSPYVVQEVLCLSEAVLDGSNDSYYKRPSRKLKDAASSVNYTQAAPTMTNIEYEINLPYNIPSDGQQHLVAILDKKMKTDFYHYLVPRLDKQAFLVAKIIDWGTMDLLPGNANIYFDGTYVGETYINTSTASDTLELALGKDRSVIAERIKEKEDVKNVLVGNNIVKTISYKIKVKNRKLYAINIIVEDQLPVSVSKDIKVKAINTGDADYSETTGILTWKARLSSKEMKNLNFSYSVEYDKDQPVANIF